ncbi:beta-ketoacyl-[acyl-carrier-protein] synthase family protein [Sinomonas mesophila]|uniref:beta-ketoacyl-[acyl-carrier-protein] synthase family protein n=1 Tax=Sinomonas mesophila TaxID=1531955 RepID=UPI0009878D2C|nr:beta-ketoacyl-[acyl-carrier-protein] synthase family protein [Sinomonas mesophila]
MRAVAITGIGAVTPLGTTADSTWAGLVAGRSGVGQIETFDPSSFPVRIAGHVRGFDAASVPAVSGAEYLGRAAGFGAAAAAEALDQAAPSAEAHPSDRRGVFVGGHVGRPEPEELAEIAHSLALTGGRPERRRDLASVLTTSQGVDITAIAEIADANGPVIGISTACASSAHALGEAVRRIRAGEITLAVAGGQDSLTTWLDVAGFSLLDALTTTHNDDPQSGSRPFEATRDGFVLGEGAVFAVLEDGEAALARGARVLAWIDGYAATMNAYRITDAPPDGGRSIDVMRRALDDAGTGPEAVDAVFAHGTSTPGNDISETTAIRAVFGGHADSLAVTATKSMTGHLTAGAGALNVLAAVYAFRDQTMPPTINYDQPDPALTLDHVPHTARAQRVDRALVNAFAFGGTNAALVLRSPHAQ